MNPIDRYINHYIIDDFFDIDEIPNFSGDTSLAFKLVETLSCGSMRKFAINKFGEEFVITTSDAEFPVGHEKLSVALCLMTLVASAKLSEDEIRDIVFEDYFGKGML